jgi:uncharacterized membrane protein
MSKIYSFEVCTPFFNSIIIGFLKGFDAGDRIKNCKNSQANFGLLSAFVVTLFRITPGIISAGLNYPQ